MDILNPIPEPAPSRRAVLFAGMSVAGGLAIGFPAEGAQKAATKVSIADGGNTGPELSAWLVIDPDNSVTIRVPHQEMGQGTATALAMVVAEELECDWTKVRVEHASANRNRREGGKTYGGMQTVGSQGVRSSVAMMQQAGASARERLRISPVVVIAATSERDGAIKRVWTAEKRDFATAVAIKRLDSIGLRIVFVLN